MKPSLIIKERRQTIMAILSRYRIANPRVFGSILHGKDTDDSDLDILVDTLPETTLFDLGGLQDELETELGISVDIKTPKDLPVSFRNQVLMEARPL
ncbi:nucleotidyltransferase [Neisseria sp. N95_16]|uniref:Nucleotidyltransferase n=1 Tax=Neisseria brasiliensis TaxID=2666100 RepID=A0A5Q3S0K9_9NEIS|nr:MULTISPECIES: nucleotidyltransferase family protein [Neisseria]MRN38012.1 nucleotidyltransferase [Neisseria brasiliensis]PJO10866.1 nucleotidyltransferase [Neisseria sp. N95_16]PJO79000.1 nucleotidyltransferase [Neisseria sp. N177_16]QGL24953.1 nucleotidyltransferase [Neisseria brasiliensis]